MVVTMHTGTHASRQTETVRHISIADVLAAGHALSNDMQASEFAVFSIGAARQRAKLKPAIDSDYPETSSASSILSSSFGNDFVRHALASTLPSWWSGERESPSIHTFEALADARYTALGLPDMPGIAFPVHADRGVAGIVVFLGTDIVLPAPAQPQIHLRCYRLFADVMLLGLGQSGRLPSVTQRELDCLKLTANGYTSEEIAVVLGLSVHTTNQYLTKVAMKLNAVNRMQAVSKALRLGLIE